MAGDELRFERLITPRPGYVLFRNGAKVAVVMKSENRRWSGTGIHLKVETTGHESRDAAATAIIAALDAAP